MQFPDTVEGVIATRIDRFGPKEQLTLKVASVVGRAFPFRVLQAVHPVAADLPELPGHLVRLEAQGLVLAEAPMPEASHLFKHIITQEVAYERLLHAQRRALHGQVARCYEAGADAGAAASFPLLAHHWQRAENSAKAMEYLEKAGEQALAASANREAAWLLRKRDQACRNDALDACGGAGSRCDGSPARAVGTPAGRRLPEAGRIHAHARALREDRWRCGGIRIPRALGRWRLRCSDRSPGSSCTCCFPRAGAREG
jgi:hypothetical protein